MAIAFLPFPTRLAAEHVHGEGAQAAALAYGFTCTAIALLFNAIWLYASRGRRLLRSDADERVVKGITRTYLPGPWIYLTATLIAFASPAASMILYLAIAGFLRLREQPVLREGRRSLDSSPWSSPSPSPNGRAAPSG